MSKIDYKILKIYGNQWENAQKSFKKKFDINKSLNGKTLAKEISRSLICINLFRDQAKNFINMRTFEVIGYGGIYSLNIQRNNQNSSKIIVIYTILKI